MSFVNVVQSAAALSLCLGASLALCPECGGKKHLGPATAALIESMQAADRSIATLPLDGRPDHDFARMMIAHHNAALDMARVELLHGTDPALRRLAQAILVEQSSEIEAMSLRLDALSAPASDMGSPAPAPRLTSDHEPTRPAQLTQAPLPGARIPDGSPASARDRVYSADQTSNTVSVIDPSTDALLGVIRLGDPAPASLAPLYRSQLLVHGLGYSPDHRTLVVVSVGSNSLTFIDTAANTIKGVAYVGRSPHEAFFTPDGREVWCTVRGQDYVSVIDPVEFREITRITVGNGPGMVMFRPDGKYAFVCSSFTPKLYVIDPSTRQIVATLDQASPFSPNIAVAPDGSELWITLKDIGKTQVWRAEPPFEQLALLDTGPITNHVTFAGGGGSEPPRAYISVGGLDEVKVFSRSQPGEPRLVATVPVGALPHGIWPSGDGRRVYVALENGGAVQAIDTQTNQVVSTIPAGQTCQALVYVPGASPTGDGAANLKPLGEAGVVRTLRLKAPDDSGDASATVAVNSLGLTDLVQLAARGLVPGAAYTLWLAPSMSTPPSQRLPLAEFTANPSGAAIVQALGPLRRLARPNSPETHAESTPENADRILLVTRRAFGAVVLSPSPR